MDRANDRCEYCLMVGWPLEVEHIMPRSRFRGSLAQRDDLNNLAAACDRVLRLEDGKLRER